MPASRLPNWSKHALTSTPDLGSQSWVQSMPATRRCLLPTAGRIAPASPSWRWMPCSSAQFICLPAGGPVYFDGFDSFTVVQRRVIAALAAQVDTVAVLLTGTADPAVSSPYALFAETADLLRQELGAAVARHCRRRRFRQPRMLCARSPTACSCRRHAEAPSACGAGYAAGRRRSSRGGACRPALAKAAHRRRWHSTPRLAAAGPRCRRIS